MGLIEIISLVTGIGGASLAASSLYLQYQDRPKILIRKFHPVLFGTKPNDGNVWKHKVEYIRLELENTGKRVAFDVSALVTFPGLDALPMFPIVDGAFQRELHIFDLKPMERLELWGTWKDGPADYYGEGHISPAEFLNNGLPAIAKIKYGDKEITKRLVREEVEKDFQRAQETMYK